MRQGADLNLCVVHSRRRRKLKRLAKAERALKAPAIKGLRYLPGLVAEKWSGLKPKTVEGFVLSLRGIPMTKDGPLKKIYPEYENKRVRMR